MRTRTLPDVFKARAAVEKKWGMTFLIQVHHTFSAFWL